MREVEAAPTESVAALNCVILGCANIWDLDRAYATFEAINGDFGLSLNTHSYNALIVTFGKPKKTMSRAMFTVSIKHIEVHNSKSLNTGDREEEDVKWGAIQKNRNLNLAT
ncbi:hypothetical protein SAY87_013885 [Trapa incisa]|uniref:Uncharacterized protein n=1 Tax=Trapa incisa TaxID=236973 RepID=A0AAN7QDK0_9MYRT|nr:hypothetical protein SAY87_013885 [Trapa incisa]